VLAVNERSFIIVGR